MLFVDGENFTIRGQGWASEQRVKLVEGRFWKEDAFLWAPFDADRGYNRATDPLAWDDHLIGSAVRSYYFTSVQGDQPKRNEVEAALWDLGFAPYLFQRDKTRGSKGVDIALTKEMLSHAFRDNYDAAALVAGDADYVPLVEEVKRLGKRVHLWFPNLPCLSRRLKIASDVFVDLSPGFMDFWKRYVGRNG